MDVGNLTHNYYVDWFVESLRPLLVKGLFLFLERKGKILSYRDYVAYSGPPSCR
jgi:hypothetical protein